jgi:hypothetical protein
LCDNGYRKIYTEFLFMFYMQKIKSIFRLTSVVSTIFCCAAVALAQSPATGGIGGRPAYPTGANIHSQSWFIYNLEPGGRVDDAVKVINTTNKTMQVDLYPTDSLLASGGSFSCEQRVDTRDGVGSWLRLSTNRITLEPGASREIPFSMTVANNADVGEHSGCIVIEDANQTPQAGGGVAVITRSAVRVYNTVPGELTRKIEISGFSVSKTDNTGVRILKPRVRNTGNVSVDTGITVAARNIFGGKAYFYEGGYTLARGDESFWEFEMKRPFWGGVYKGNFAATYDANSSASLGVSANSSLTTLQSRVVWFWSWPTTWGWVAWLVLALLAWYGYRLYRRHQATWEWIKNSWVNHMVGRDEGIDDLGEKYNVDWRLIAKANEMTSPYTLKMGQNIKVPPTRSKSVEAAPAAKATKVKVKTKPKTKPVVNKKTPTNKPAAKTIKRTTKVAKKATAKKK